VQGGRLTFWRYGAADVLVKHACDKALIREAFFRRAPLEHFKVGGLQAAIVGPVGFVLHAVGSLEG
jgi:hypothetical protein